MDAAKKGRRCVTTALAVTGAMDSAHHYRLNDFDLVTPDGQPPKLAVGAAFDYHAGLLQQPPQLLQRYGLPCCAVSVRNPGVFGGVISSPTANS
jgi:N-acetylglucosaminyldiphosphoundecaprenol N-acetyl-beta-D-mannosaminyltransferase